MCFLAICIVGKSVELVVAPFTQLIELLCAGLCAQGRPSTREKYLSLRKDSFSV